MKRITQLVAGALTVFASLNAVAAPANMEELRSQAMNPKLTNQQRMDAIRAMYPEDFAEGMPSRKICIWDLVGKTGPIYNAAQDIATRIMELGVQIELEAFTSEAVLTEDLKAGQCDAALMTGLRARSFNKYTGTIDAIGALPSSDHMKLLMRAITQPQNADKMVDGQYVVLGYAPMGAAYIFVNDRSINTLAKAAGKRVAVMDYDLVQADMVAQIGANPVPTSPVSAGAKFNNGIVDVLPAPLVAYNVMELYKGIKDTGGVIDYPFSQLTLQLIGRTDRFHNEIAQLVREYFMDHYHDLEKIVAAQVGEVPDSVWIPIPPEDKAEYEVMMQEARIQLREHGYYDGDMLALERKVRCKFKPDHFECANPVE